LLALLACPVQAQCANNRFRHVQGAARAVGLRLLKDQLACARLAEALAAEALQSDENLRAAPACQQKPSTSSQ